MAKRDFTIWLVLLAFAELVGCSQSSVPTKPAATATGLPRTIQMDDASLFLATNCWVYSYPTDSGKRHIVGDNVKFLTRKADHIVVVLDPSLELNVPISGKHFLVDINGFHDILADLDGKPVDEDMIRDVINDARR